MKNMLLSLTVVYAKGLKFKKKLREKNEMILLASPYRILHKQASTSTSGCPDQNSLSNDDRETGLGTSEYAQLSECLGVIPNILRSDLHGNFFYFGWKLAEYIRCMYGSASN